jgi:hypothetical protein
MMVVRVSLLLLTIGFDSFSNRPVGFKTDHAAKQRSQSSQGETFQMGGGQADSEGDSTGAGKSQGVEQQTETGDAIQRPLKAVELHSRRWCGCHAVELTRFT